jgi:effector-binding domain-containing protein
MQDLDLEIGYPVAKKLADKDNMKASEIAAGKYASTVHVGPYETMEPTYDALNKWIKDNGHEVEGPAIELYFNDPGEVGPENTRTEIQFPLKL